MRLGERLKIVRGGKTQKELAAEMGVNVNTYAMYERDERSPDAKFLESLCRKFEINPEWLLLGEEEQRQPKISIQPGPEVPFPPKEGPMSGFGLEFLLFMIQKTPDTFRELPYDTQGVIATSLWRMSHSMTEEELTLFHTMTEEEFMVFQIVLQAWLEYLSENPATEGSKRT